MGSTSHQTSCWFDILRAIVIGRDPQLCAVVNPAVQQFAAARGWDLVSVGSAVVCSAIAMRN